MFPTSANGPAQRALCLAAPVPEPQTLTLAAVGGSLLARRQRPVPTAE